MSGLPLKGISNLALLQTLEFAAEQPKFFCHTHGDTAHWVRILSDNSEGSYLFYQLVAIGSVISTLGRPAGCFLVKVIKKMLYTVSAYFSDY